MIDLNSHRAPASRNHRQVAGVAEAHLTLPHGVYVQSKSGPVSVAAFLFQHGGPLLIVAPRRLRNAGALFTPTLKTRSRAYVFSEVV